MCAHVHTKSLTQAKDYFPSPNVTKFELLWLKQRWSGGCKPHFRITLTLRQLLYNCCGSDPLELALTGVVEKMLLISQVSSKPEEVHSRGTSKGWRAKMKISQTTTNGPQQRLLQGGHIPLPAPHLQTATSLCSTLFCIYTLYYLIILTTL